jgi:phage major head subunit gpT-like protein
MAGTVSTRTSTQAQTKVLEKAYINASQEEPPLYDQFFNVITTNSKRSFATWLPIADLGTLEWKGEGQAPAYDQPYELIPYTANFFSYALAVKATEEADLEDPENYVGKIPGMLADSCRESKDLIFWNAVNTGFDPRVLGTDGVPLFSTAHPLGPISTPTGVVSSIGANFSNSLGATALTPEALQQARILFRTLLTDRGKPDHRTPRTLMVPESMEKVAKEISGSDQAPFSTDNRTNVLKGSDTGIKVMTNRYLTQQNAWYLCAGKGDPFSGKDNHQLFVAFKWDNRYKAWTDPETDNYSQKTSFRCTYGFAGWRGIVGALGSAGNI